MKSFDEMKGPDRRHALRLMMSAVGINGLLEDLGYVCYDVSNEDRNKDNSYSQLWSERGDELIELGRQYNVGRRATR